MARFLLLFVVNLKAYRPLISDFEYFLFKDLFAVSSAGQRATKPQSLCWSLLAHHRSAKLPITIPLNQTT